MMFSPVASSWLFTMTIGPGPFQPHTAAASDALVMSLIHESITPHSPHCTPRPRRTSRPELPCTHTRSSSRRRGIMESVFCARLPSPNATMVYATGTDGDMVISTPTTRHPDAPDVASRAGDELPL